MTNPTSDFIAGLAADKAIILVIDDNPASLSTLVNILAPAGFEILVAQSGQAAFRHLAYVIPDIILLDNMLPKIDGHKICHRLKADPLLQNIPIILMTALSDATSQVTKLEVNTNDYITKPFQQADVLAKVRHQLKSQLITQQPTIQNYHLETLQRQKDEFLIPHSHDSRLPLASINLVIGLLALVLDRQHNVKSSVFSTVIGSSIGR